MVTQTAHAFGMTIIGTDGTEVGLQVIILLFLKLCSRIIYISCFYYYTGNNKSRCSLRL